VVSVQVVLQCLVVSILCTVQVILQCVVVSICTSCFTMSSGLYMYKLFTCCTRVLYYIVLYYIVLYYYVLYKYIFIMPTEDIYESHTIQTIRSDYFAEQH
jgi:hypothetical protein